MELHIHAHGGTDRISGYLKEVGLGDGKVTLKDIAVNSLMIFGDKIRVASVPLQKK